ncbi:MAG: DUF5041 domain-containing protein [Tannerella sp.]|jgi:hypothetical protein|nr:DUF5041 domain-containing protein [Tannerella sp.]
MKSLTSLAILFFFSLSLSAQNFEYKKDLAPQNVKADRHNMYRSEDINSIDLMKALEFSGINIFKFNLTPFEKKYKMVVFIDEYADGEKVNTQEVFGGDNTYIHFEEGAELQEMPTPYFDYIDQFVFYVKNDTDHSMLKYSSYSMESTRKLEKKKLRDFQFYQWRTYSKANWKLNETVPMLIYASSWFDDRYNVERFCGVMDLSLKEEFTQELLDNSPHYYVISCKISE